MANVLFKRGNTATIDGTAITDGQLLYNTTTGQHYIDSDLTRKEVGKPVVNTTAEVSAITVDNISCGTKPVKELISNLSYPSIRTATISNINSKISNNYSSVKKVGLIVIFSILFVSTEQISSSETIFNVDIPNMSFGNGFVSVADGTTRLVSNNVPGGGLKANDGLPAGTWMGYLICNVNEA